MEKLPQLVRTLSTKASDSDIDLFVGCLHQLRSLLTDSQKQSIQTVIALYLNRLSAQFNEHQSEQMFKLVVLFETWPDQQAILIISASLKLINIAHPTLLVIVLQNMKVLIRSDSVKELALPQLTSNMVNILLKSVRVKVHELALDTLEELILFVMTNYKLSNTYDIMKLQKIQLPIVIERINEYLQQLCLIAHDQSANWGKIYHKFVYNLLEKNTIITEETQYQLISFSLRYSDDFNLPCRMDVNQYLFELIIKLPKLRNSLNSDLITQHFRQILFYLNQPHKLNNECCRYILQGLVFQDTKIIDKTCITQYMKIANNDPKIVKLIEQVLYQINQNNSGLGQYFMQKMKHKLEKLSQQVMVSTVIKLSIQEILDLCQLIFIVNSMKIDMDERQLLSLIQQAQNLIIDSTESYINLLNHLFSILFDRSCDEFLKLSKYELLIILNNQVALTQDEQNSILLRTIQRLQDPNSDKGHALKILLYIFSNTHVKRNITLTDQLFQTLFTLHDRYFIKSDPQFVVTYLRFLINLLKQQIEVSTNQLRNIILQISSHFNSQHQYLAYQVFLGAIPYLAQKPLVSKPNELFGMNDDVNVTIPDTLGALFHEVRPCFELTFRSDNSIARLWAWRCIHEMWVKNPEMHFWREFPKWRPLEQDPKIQSEIRIWQLSGFPA